MDNSFSMSQSQTNSTQVVSNSITVPIGYAVSSSSWRGTQLAENLKNAVSVTFCEDMGLVDFMTSQDTAVLLITESDLLSGNDLKKRIARFKHHNKKQLKGIILAVNNSGPTREVVQELESWVGIEMDFTFISVSDMEEACSFLVQLVSSRNKLKSNPFNQKPKSSPNPHSQLVKTAEAIPGMGPKRAQQVLTDLSPLSHLPSVSNTALGTAVGNTASAMALHNFLHEDNRFGNLN